MFSPEIQLEGNFTNKYRNKESHEYFRFWSFVSAHEVKHIAVIKIHDEIGSFYVSDTRFYIPWWLKSDGTPPQNEILPDDQVLSKNNIAIPVQRSNDRKCCDRKVVNAVREENRVNDNIGPVSWFSWRYWVHLFNRARQILVAPQFYNYQRKSYPCVLATGGEYKDADIKNSIWSNQRVADKKERNEEDPVTIPCLITNSAMNLIGSSSKTETSSTSWTELSDFSIPIRRCELSIIAKYRSKSHLRSYDNAYLNQPTPQDKNDRENPMNSNRGRFELREREKSNHSSLRVQDGIGNVVADQEFLAAGGDLGNTSKNVCESVEHTEECLVSETSSTSMDFTNLRFSTLNKSRNRIELSSPNDSSIDFLNWEKAYIAKFRSNSSVSHEKTVSNPNYLFAEIDRKRTSTTNESKSAMSNSNENAVSEKLSSTDFTWSDQSNKKFFGTYPSICGSNSIKGEKKPTVAVNLSSSESRSSSNSNENLIVTSTPFCHHEVSSIAENRTKSSLSVIDLIDSTTSSDQNVSLSGHDVIDVPLDHQIERNMSITDVNIIKKYIDSVLVFEDWHKNTLKDRDYLDKLLRDATMKTAIESLNLRKKGIFDTQRYVKLCKQLSINSIEISKTAAQARTKYNKEAKKMNEARVARILKLDDNVKAAFQNVLHSKLLSYATNIPKETHICYETAAELKQTALYHSILKDLLKEEQ